MKHICVWNAAPSGSKRVPSPSTRSPGNRSRHNLAFGRDSGLTVESILHRRPSRGVCPFGIVERRRWFCVFFFYTWPWSASSEVRITRSVERKYHAFVKHRYECFVRVNWSLCRFWSEPARTMRLGLSGPRERWARLAPREIQKGTRPRQEYYVVEAFSDGRTDAARAKRFENVSPRWAYNIFIFKKSRVRRTADGCQKTDSL